MDNFAPTSAAEAVANGAQLLDDVHPGWWRHINLETLHIGSISMCVCGQLDIALNGAEFPSWTSFANSLNSSLTLSSSLMRYEDYGFRAAYGWTYEKLNVEWRLLIQARLDADTLSAPVEEREVVLA